MQQAQAAPDGVKGNWRVLTSLALRSDDNSRALSALVLNVMIILKNQECTERLGGVMQCNKQDPDGMKGRIGRNLDVVLPPLELGRELEGISYRKWRAHCSTCFNQVLP